MFSKFAGSIIAAASEIPAQADSATAMQSQDREANGEIAADVDSATIETRWATRLLRVAACSATLYQVVYLALARIYLADLPAAILLHLLNIAIGLAALAATLAPPPWLRRHWELAAFALCAGISTGMTAIALSCGDQMQFFVAMILFALGTGALLPWRSAWQAAFSAVALTEFAVVFGWPSSYTGICEWMGIVTAAGLSQGAVLVNERFRYALRAHVEMMLQGRELLRAEMAERARAEQKLRESETILRRIFDAAPDPIVLVRVQDSTFTDVNSAFESIGFSRAETIGQTTEQLAIWNRIDQREEYRRRLRTDGLVRNMEMEWRCKDGRVIPALLSGAAVELNGELCAVNLVRDISKLKRTENELIAAREAALAASRAKSEFLSTMSHEIRTPMNAILGIADLLAETGLNLEQRRYLDVMRNNGGVLLDLINDVLDLAKVESGLLKLERVDFDLEAVTDKLGETLGLRAHEKGLELVVRIAPGAPRRLIGDPLRLRQILLNLTGNAIKFTESGEVVVAIENEPGGAPGELRFTITDTGIGIPGDKLDQIFTPFTQADSSMARKYGGSGLGLAIVRRLVNLMGGRLWAESKPGAGSVFGFTVGFGVRNAAASVDRARENPTPLKALVADDNGSARAHVAEMLREWGLDVDEAESGREALGMIDGADRNGDPYRLIVLDARMPQMDGFAVARELKHRRHPAVVMMLTADNLNLQLGIEREVGASAYLVKPVRRRELLEVVRSATEAAAPNETPAAPAVAEQPPDRALRILLVEDSPDNRLVVRAYLKKTPYRIEEAENGEIGFRKFTAGDYDLVLMDLQMPVTDGLTAMRMIREWEREHGARRTPIIALTASALEEDRRKSFAAGADTHVSKPVKKATLLDSIRTALQDPAEATALVAATAAD